MVGTKIFYAIKRLTKVKSVFRGLSLRTQLLLILLFILLISVSSLSIISARSEELIIDKVTDDLDDITKAIQISVEELTYRGDSTQRLKSYVDMLNRKGVKEISIISDDAQVIASSNPKKIGTTENPKKIAGQDKVGAEEKPHHYRQARRREQKRGAAPLQRDHACLHQGPESRLHPHQHDP